MSVGNRIINRFGVWGREVLEVRPRRAYINIPFDRIIIIIIIIIIFGPDERGRRFVHGLISNPYAVTRRISIWLLCLVARNGRRFRTVVASAFETSSLARGGWRAISALARRGKWPSELVGGADAYASAGPPGLSTVLPKSTPRNVSRIFVTESQPPRRQTVTVAPVGNNGLDSEKTTTVRRYCCWYVSTRYYL